ncbi:ABC transporter ATP-binding protein [Pseudosulfitobacter pseudonitzschiae]|uniref:ABC transporter ATP-binding protein n=1 Tax=Pseudosulfitobacter pseudonitzschiae TaxID=1402135 RepID=UPI001AF9445B|nr:ATP-binding cassette domain-containing protein [Pseudosulfitobacter pseudonitzschiae]MBM1817781.1 ABC transporter ATP-binding protein [Pseudosulfitobacter pseudonitzschiae]MBM1834776.1 ABC transporter ATP-binding protein [Pseudosulfitobacter pseudonitzschiae]MBM1839640.1 ABC transporter ATP-binding protein [Pseudosulfitobacter pseudonitzschiae]MBM1844491.1 ABC transporter ATP-binding protein [Pseudosulfitobacter pseudonitzschiae]MBM1849325.1 ABC transporter ATP-binding protein [Pseudosulfit
MTLLKADDITVAQGGTPILHPVSLHLEPEEPLVVLGETGSGKSLLAQAIMGTLPRDLAARGRVVLGDHLLDAARPEGFRPHWGLRIAVLPQEPWLSLDPLMRAGRQVTEAHHLVRGLGTQDARAQAATDLDRLGLAHAGTRYPHELSGGMAQRVAIAAARAGGAGIVIADEPTKGLDAARRDEVADLLLAELARGGGLLVITHDLALARRIGGRMIVLRAGRVVETGPTAAVMAAPTQAYTRDLIAADPENWPARNRRPAGAPVLTATRLAAGRGGVRLFSDLSFDLSAGRILGVTGPSGCGKSTLGDVVLGLAPPAAGRVNRSAGLAPTAFQKLYQDPVAAFPRHRTLGRTLADVAHRHGQPRDRIDTLLPRLGLNPVLLTRTPGAVSGGELQRLALLRLLLVRPRFIFADEPTSRLDPITQKQVIDLLRDTAATEGCAIMLVSHDPELVARTADHVLSLAPAKTGDDLSGQAVKRAGGVG